MKGDIVFLTDSTLSVRQLIEWLEKRKSVNVTIVIQNIGDITNSHLENINIIDDKLANRI